MTKASNSDAQAFKALHVPGKPLLLANVYDATSARIVASLPGCAALATASYAVALANGTADPDLSLETQLSTVAAIAEVARAAGKPLSVDLQGGYSEKLEDAVRGVIGLGAVGINLEDSDQETGATILSENEAVERIRRVLRVAAEEGVPDFVVNARCDINLRATGSLGDGVRRARGYLEAGATTAFVLVEGMRDMTREEVEMLVRELDGRVNIPMRIGYRPGVKEEEGARPLTAAELAGLGVARVSVGPQLYLAAAAAIKAAAGAVFGGAAC